jgi:polyisoprenoid-binding protein YceI
MKKIKLMQSVALAASLASAASASATIVTYTWDQAATSLPGYTSTGSLQYDTGLGLVTSITFTEHNATLGFSGTVSDFAGGATVLSGPASVATEQHSYDNTMLTGAWVAAGYGDLQLNGVSIGSETPNSGPFLLGWAPTAVPEPTTVIAGASLLLPFGGSMLRILRRKQTA